MIRRARFLTILGTTALSGCAGIATNLTENASFHRMLELPERLNLAILGAGQPHAREYAESDISPMFRQNGFDPPSTSDYTAWSHAGWRGYRLFVSGLVATPKSYDIAPLRGTFSSTSKKRRQD